tara:strand:+ start:226 stop:963 length:738 start_codon:yes stop_codon:yes gene_type:complete
MDKFDQIFLFDFDGVICDSSRELYQNSLETFLILLKKYQIHSNKIIKNRDDLHSDFLNHLKHGNSSEAFFLIWNDIFIKKKLISKNIFSQNLKLHKDEYKKEFYKNRKKIIRKSINSWIDLHKFNKYLTRYINNFKNKEKLFVVSAKDLNSLIVLLKKNKVNILRKNIISTSKYSSKEKIFKLFAKKYKNYKINLIEDSVENIVLGNKLGFNCYYATWFAQPLVSKTKIKTISIQDIKKVLIKNN